MKDSLIKILDHYGINAQVEKLREEVAELNLALARFSVSTEVDSINPVIEEIADVENLVAQVKFAFRVDEEVLSMRYEKILRTQKRIEQEIENESRPPNL